MATVRTEAIPYLSSTVRHQQSGSRDIILRGRTRRGRDQPANHQCNTNRQTAKLPPGIRRIVHVHASPLLVYPCAEHEWAAQPARACLRGPGMTQRNGHGGWEALAARMARKRIAEIRTTRAPESWDSSGLSSRMISSHTGETRFHARQGPDDHGIDRGRRNSRPVMAA